jgi:hypothetical protein
VNMKTLAESYLEKATKRLRVLDVLLEEEAFSDVVREAQELVELALKGILRYVGVDPPKWHDVGPIIAEHRDLLPVTIRGTITSRETSCPNFPSDQCGRPRKYVSGPVMPKPQVQMSNQIPSLNAKVIGVWALTFT